MVIMFNRLDEQLFACQTLLKEQRQPSTGGLMEALEESLGRGVSTPPAPIVGSKTTLESLEFCFPLRKTIGYCFVRNCPHRGVFCRSLFSCGDHKRAYLFW